MRALAGLLWAYAALQTYAASSEASVYFFDKNPKPLERQPPSVSPSTARLLLAQRLGLSQYHSLKDASDSTLEYLNSLEGSQKSIFLDEHQEPLRLLIFVEGWEDPKDIVTPTIGPAFTISPPPSPSQNLKLALDLLSQDRHRRSFGARTCSFELPDHRFVRGGTSGRDEGFQYCGLAGYMNNYREGDAMGELQHLADSPSTSEDVDGNGRTTILHISSLLKLQERIMVDNVNEDKKAYNQATFALKAAFQNLSRLPNTVELTIVLIPPPSSKTKHTDYGIYENPSTLHARQFQPEEPLSAPSEPSPSNPSPKSPANNPHTLAKNSTLFKGPLRVCHPNLEAAQLATNNCSSHGTVYKKFATPEDDVADCYACKCNKTIITNDEGKTIKTIFWGGPACQKKDVSVPFFLLAGFTIAMLGAVSWGIGLLFSIGQEELPSVIGAGVAGPRAQK